MFAQIDYLWVLLGTIVIMAVILTFAVYVVISSKRELAERKRAEEALRESEGKYRAIFEQAADSIVLVDSETGELIEFNDRIHENLGYTREEFEKLKIPDFEVIESVEEVAKHIEKIIKKGFDAFETKHRTKDGEIRDILVNSRAISIHGKDFVMSIWRDITERRQAEEALRGSEGKYRSLVESTDDAVYLISRNMRYEFANGKYLSRLGLSLAELVGQEYGKLHPWDTNDEFAEKVDQVIKSGKPMVYEHLSHRDNKYFMRTLSPVIGEKPGEIKAITVTSKDITERKQAEKELSESREQLRSLSAHLQSVREESQKLLAREIHDELGQDLTALKMDLSWMKGRLRPDQKLLQEKGAAMTKLSDAMIQTVKRITARLRPTLLDDLGVVAALEWESGEFAERTGIGCDLTVEPEGLDLDPDRVTTVYRIFQEALTNVARHAQATNVKISIKIHAGTLEMEIRDNGIGITEEQVASPRSFGLIGIRERVLQWDGEAIIEGRKGKGTTLAVTIPLDNGGGPK